MLIFVLHQRVVTERIWHPGRLGLQLVRDRCLALAGASPVSSCMSFDSEPMTAFGEAAGVLKIFVARGLFLRRHTSLWLLYFRILWCDRCHHPYSNFIRIYCPLVLLDGCTQLCGCPQLDGCVVWLQFPFTLASLALRLLQHFGSWTTYLFSLSHWIIFFRFDFAISALLVAVLILEVDLNVNVVRSQSGNIARHQRSYLHTDGTISNLFHR